MKKKITLIILIIAALILGSIIGKNVDGVENLKWLGYSKSLSMSTSQISLPIIILNFGFDLSINIAQIIMTVIAVIAYPKVLKLLNA